METTYKIYRIYLNPENNRVVYVGMTSKHPAVRLYDLCGINQSFKNAIEKYGRDCFSYDIIETVSDRNIAFEREAYWTNYYSSISPLFNIGIGKYSQSNKSKEEMRDFYDKTLRIWIQENGGPNKGRKMSEETRIKHMSNSRSKPVKCEETGVLYPSINQAHLQTGIAYKDIKLACSDSLTAGGYHWNFIKEDN